MWQLAISTGARPMSWLTTCFRTGSKRAVRHEPATPPPIQGPRVVWWVWRSRSTATPQEQRAGNPVYLLRTCEHADAAHIWQTAAALQEAGGCTCEKWLPATAVKQIPPPPLQIWHWIQPDPAHNTHKREHPEGLFVSLSYKPTAISGLKPKDLHQLVAWVNALSCQLQHCKVWISHWSPQANMKTT